MTTIKNFWDNTHPLAEIASAKYDELVPARDHCASLQGELIRASTRIGYDWYNNGWGCNNWSGAVQFILARFSNLPNQPSAEIIADLRKNLAIVADYSHGEPCHINDDLADEVVTKIHEIIIQAVIDNPELIANTTDMFSYQEEDYREHADEEDDFGYDDDDDDEDF